MVHADGFDRKMLLMGTQLAHESGLKALLLFVLQELFQSVQKHEGIDADAEAITIIRCMIRLDLRLMAENATDS